MNETKRLIMVFVIFVIVISIILLISFWPEKDRTFVCGVKADENYEKLGKADYKQYQCLLKEERKIPLVVGKLNKNEKDKLAEAAKKANHAIYYLDIKSIEDSDLKAIKKKLKYNNSSFKDNVILIIEKGKVIEFNEDILSDSDEIYEFLKNSGIVKYICDVVPDEENESLGTITYEQYRCLYESEEIFTLVVSQTTCGYCTSFKPIIAEYAEKNDIPVYVLEVNTLTTDDKNAFLSSLDYFDENQEWGTPLTFGIKNQEIISYMAGFTESEEDIENFFKEIGLK